MNRLFVVSGYVDNFHLQWVDCHAAWCAVQWCVVHGTETESHLTYATLTKSQSQFIAKSYFSSLLAKIGNIYLNDNKATFWIFVQLSRVKLFLIYILAIHICTHECNVRSTERIRFGVENVHNTHFRRFYECDSLTTVKFDSWFSSTLATGSNYGCACMRDCEHILIEFWKRLLEFFFRYEMRWHLQILIGI